MMGVKTVELSESPKYISETHVTGLNEDFQQKIS